MLLIYETLTVEELQTTDFSPAERRRQLRWIAAIRRRACAGETFLVQIGEEYASSPRFLFQPCMGLADIERNIADITRIYDTVKYPATYPLLGWIPLDPSELTPASAAELATLLGLIMRRASLSSGQLAVKAGIPRSQVYRLIEPGTQSVPRSRPQLTHFLRACRVAPEPRGVGTDQLA